MIRKARMMVCLLLTICLAAGTAPAFAAGGHKITTDAPAVTDAPTSTPTATPTAEPIATVTPSPSPTSVPEGTEVPQMSADGTIIGESGLIVREDDSTDKTAKAESSETESPAEIPTEEPTQAPEEPTAEPEPQGNNRVDEIFEINLPAEQELFDAARYEYALHVRPESYDPASVLISGIIYLPEGREIDKAVVTVEGGSSHEIPRNEILRMKNGFEPDSVAQLQFEPDRARSGFAILADLSGDNLPDGETQVTVTLTADMEIALNTTVNIQEKQGQFFDVDRALWGQCLVLNDEHDQVTALQRRLSDLGYMKDEEVTGKCDERTLAAANELIGKNHLIQYQGYLSAEAVGFIESSEAQAKSAGFFDRVLNFFKGTVHLFNRDIPVWMLTAAGAALLLLILLIILLITGKKRKARRKERQAAAAGDLNGQKAFITSPDNDAEEPTGDPAAKILTIGDEPTMDLNEAAPGGIVFNEDEPTTDLKENTYTVKFRLIYGDRYMDKDILLQDGGQAVIGRGEDTEIRTNPEDTSVSHRHGTFTITGGMLTYTDTSRNGTRFNGQRTIYRGESASIPFNTKAQLEIGAHKVLVFAIKQ